MRDELGAPRVVDRSTFQAELDALRLREKAHTREGDAIAAARRRLPMVAVDGATPLIGEHGAVTLLDVFEGRVVGIPSLQARPLGGRTSIGTGNFLAFKPLFTSSFIQKMPNDGVTRIHSLARASGLRQTKARGQHARCCVNRSRAPEDG
jgi:hypothetical protein